MKLNTIYPNHSIPQEFQKRKQALNKDFFKNAKIRGLVSTLYYPMGRPPPISHAELEVEGSCYTIFLDEIKERSLSQKIANARTGSYPFAQCHISVIPKQLAKIKKVLSSKISSTTCMDGVSVVLGKSGGFYIPPLINQLPLASYLYLQGAKLLGNKRITKMEHHGNANLTNLARITIGVSFETWVIPTVAWLL